MANDENIKSNCEHLHKGDVMQKNVEIRKCLKAVATAAKRSVRLPSKCTKYILLGGL